jgi:hypothetical protein
LVHPVWHALLVAHVASAQSVRWLQLSSLPFVQSSGAGSVAPVHGPHVAISPLPVHACVPSVQVPTPRVDGSADFG